MHKIHFEIIDSTNTYLKKHYQELDNYTFVSADNQTDGKGREERIWYSSKDNLQFSLLIKDEAIIAHYKEISIISAYTILKVLENYHIDNLMIKWPNDIYASDKKICGILLEAITCQKVACLIIGIGLNVNQEVFEQVYLHEPTSLKKILRQEIDISKLKEEIYTSLINNLNNLNKDFYPLIKEYDYLKNKEAYALINKQKKLIKVIQIASDYSLEIIIDNKKEKIETGEISFHV